MERTNHLLFLPRSGIGLLVYFFFLSITDLSGQAQKLKIESIKNFQQRFLKDIKLKSTVSLTGTDSILSIRFSTSLISEHGGEFMGVVEGEEFSNVFFHISPYGIEGKVILPRLKKVYSYYTSGGWFWVEEQEIDQVLCTEYHEVKGMEVDFPVAGLPEGESVYSLESYPEAEAVVLLDFDGQYVSGTRWNGGKPILAAPSYFSENQIYVIWQLISEDFRPFTLNITTDSTKYWAADANRRMRVIFTPTNTASPGSGGVAYVGSFGNIEDNDTPCWVFNTGTRSAAEAGSHEIGHTLGLRHDGRKFPEEYYYSGHGNWAPIMGTGYSKSMVQWSKGEYQFANNVEDDLAIIVSSLNGIYYRNDEAGESAEQAKPLLVEPDGTVSSLSNHGIITQSTDVDIYSFYTTGGRINLLVNPAFYYPNLDVLVKLMDSTGRILSTADSASAFCASISTELPEGKFYLLIDGTGSGSPLNTGYSDYASIGAYSIEGYIPLEQSKSYPPVVQIVYPQNGSMYEEGESVVIKADALDEDGGIKFVLFIINGDTAKVDDTFPYSYNIDSLISGSYVISVTAVDISDLESDADSLTITVLSPPDCHGDRGGGAYYDICGRCVGGSTLRYPCSGYFEAESGCEYSNSSDADGGEDFPEESGYVNFPSGIDTHIKWFINSLIEDTVVLSFRYSSISDENIPVKIRINGQICADSILLPGTSGWDIWDTFDTSVIFSAGINSLEIEASGISSSLRLDLVGFVSQELYQVDCNVVVTDMEIHQTRDDDFKVFPNPFLSTVQIKAEGNFYYSVLNILGEEIDYGTMQDSLYIGNALDNGIYFIKIYSAEKSKIIKVRKL